MSSSLDGDINGINVCFVLTMMTYIYLDYWTKLNSLWALILWKIISPSIMLCLFQYNLRMSKPFSFLQWLENLNEKYWNTVYWLLSFLGKSSMDLEESTTKSSELKVPRIKEVLKERKVLEKKVALSKKRRKDSRYMFYLAMFPL